MTRPIDEQRIAAFFEECEKKKREGTSWQWELKPDDRPLESLSYEEYLETKQWKRIRRRVLKRDQQRCRCCGGKATLVHHRSYSLEVLRGENDEQLASVCEGCHDYIHYDDAGVERSPDERDKVLLRGRELVIISAPKVDLRRKSPKRPQDWKRMSAVQRAMWDQQYQIEWLTRHRDKETNPKRRAVYDQLLKAQEEATAE